MNDLIVDFKYWQIIAILVLICSNSVRYHCKRHGKKLWKNLICSGHTYRIIILKGNNTKK